MELYDIYQVLEGIIPRYNHNYVNFRLMDLNYTSKLKSLKHKNGETFKGIPV